MHASQFKQIFRTFLDWYYQWSETSAHRFLLETQAKTRATRTPREPHVVPATQTTTHEHTQTGIKKSAANESTNYIFLLNTSSMTIKITHQACPQPERAPDDCIIARAAIQKKLHWFSEDDHSGAVGELQLQAPCNLILHSPTSAWGAKIVPIFTGIGANADKWSPMKRANDSLV